MCARAGSLLDRDDSEVYVLGAAGEYAKFINHPVADVKNIEIEDPLEKQLSESLNESILSISIYSTVAIESSFYDCYPIVFNPSWSLYMWFLKPSFFLIRLDILEKLNKLGWA